MSSSNNRFGRRTARQNDELRAEPVLSFNPKRPGARDARPSPGPAAARKPQTGLRVDREDAEEFGYGRDTSFERGTGPRVERDDDFDPRARREKALDTRVPEGERPLYHHLFDEQENRRRGFGWIAALASVAVVAVGAAYAWHNFMARPAPAGLLQPPGFTMRNNGTGYTTPPQPANNADNGADTNAAPAPLVAAPPVAPDQQPTRDVAATPAPKSVPYEAPPPPKKTISEAAANPGSLGPPVANPATTPAPAPASAPPVAKKQPAAAPAPILTPPAKHDAAKPEAKRETPRKEAAITPPKPAPAPQEAAPPAVTLPTAAPEPLPRPRPRPSQPQMDVPQATGQPQQLNRDAPANFAPPQPQFPAPQQQRQPANAAPAPTGPDTVTIDGVTYVNGQQPHALGTIGAPPQASDAPMPPGVPALPQSPPPGYSTRSYAPADRDGGAPLPNDVIILPNGQMAVPNGR